MIQNMKKLTFLVTAKEYESFLTAIRNIGVVHIEELQKGATSDELQAALDLDTRFKNVMKELDYAREAYEPTDEKVALDISDKTPQGIIRYVEDLSAEELSLRHQQDAVEKDIEALEPWGDIDWDKLSLIEAQGYRANFYVCASKLFKPEWRDKYFATPVNAGAKDTYFVTFSADTPDITAEQLSLPVKKLSAYQAEKEELEAKIADAHNRMVAVDAQYRDTLLKGQTANENDISLSRVHLSHESLAGDAVRLLVGWVPEGKDTAVVDYLDTNHVYYELTAPDFDDNVPIQIHNNKFSSLFEPILRMYSLPNYHDIDPLPMFAPFFMLFFGLCMGDAGYGAIILAISIAVLS